MEKQNSYTSSSDIKRFIRAMLTFAVLTVTWYICFFFIGSKITVNKSPVANYYSDYFSIKGGDTYLRYNQYNKNAMYDALVLGSSHAYRSYDPRIFKTYNFNMYNLGSSGQSINDTYIVARELINLQKKPILIIDIYPKSFEVDGIESSSKLVANSPTIDFAKQIAFNTFDWRIMNVFMVRCLSNSAPLPFVNNEHNGKYVAGGYVEIQKENNKKYNYGGIGKKFTPTTVNISAFEKLVDFIHLNSLKTYFVFHPIPNETCKTESKQFAAFIANKINGKNNIRFLNLSFNHSLDKNKHFYDHHHLNHAGTTIYNNMLLDLINKL